MSGQVKEDYTGLLFMSDWTKVREIVGSDEKVVPWISGEKETEVAEKTILEVAAWINESKEARLTGRCCLHTEFK